MSDDAAGRESGSLNPADIRDIMDVLTKSGWDEAVITVGDTTIAVARNGAHLPSGAGVAAPAAAPTPPPAAAAPAAAAAPMAPPPAAPPAAPTTPPAAPAPGGANGSSAVTGDPVTAPSVGVFWRAPEPGAPPFVEVGQRVEAGQELCIVEVMKLMNRVVAPSAGTVAAVHVDNGEAVEFGTVLFTLSP